MQGSRRFRTAWIVAGSTFAVLALGYGTTSAVGLLAHEESVEHEVVRAAVRRVEVRADGDVTITGTERDSVDVTAHVSRGLRAPDRGVRVAGDRLLVEASCPVVFDQWCDLDYVLEVPRGVAVVVRTREAVDVTAVTGGVDVSTDGDVDVEDVGGTVRLRSGDGSIRGARLVGGSFEASSEQDGVDVTFRRAPESVTAAARETVVVTLPGDAPAYRVDATGREGVAIDVRTDPASHRTITVHSSSDEVVIRPSST